MKGENVRHEPHTIGGETRLVPVREAEPPTDWDLIATRFVIGVVVLFTVGTMIWSTVAIATLLALIAPIWAAVVAGTLFDLAWIWCKVVGLLGRYEPERVKSVKRAGVFFLVIAMTLILADGVKSSNLLGGTGEFRPINLLGGVAGACVSLVAWRLWNIAEGFFAVELTELDTAFLSQARRELQVEIAQQLNRRVIGRYTARLAALTSANQNDMSVLSFQTLPHTRTDTVRTHGHSVRTLPYGRTDTRTLRTDTPVRTDGHTDTDTPSVRTDTDTVRTLPNTDTDTSGQFTDTVRTDTDMSGSVRTDGQTVSVPCTPVVPRVTQLWTPGEETEHPLLSRKRDGSLAQFVLSQMLAGCGDAEIREIVARHPNFFTTKKEYLTRVLRTSRAELEQQP